MISLLLILSLILQAIHGYRETERLKWNTENTAVIQRVRELAFPPGSPQLKHVHVLDLDAKGLIKPHIDSTRVRTYICHCVVCINLY